MRANLTDHMQIAPGDLISHYMIEDTLGQGGMGAVYKACDQQTGRKVALKVMFDVASAQRFKIESEALSVLRHPGIPEIYEVGEDPLFFYAQEIVEGPSLESRLGQGIALPEAVRIFQSLLGVLDVVHSHGYVHRDITPNNLLLRGEQCTLIDFGLVRVLDADHGLTTSGEVLGTPQYMAPEQIDPKFGAITPQTDLFAAGTILYRLVCGRLPTEPGSYPRIMRQVVMNPPVPPPEGLSPALVEVVLKALAKKPADRYPSARAFSEALAQASP